MHAKTTLLVLGGWILLAAATGTADTTLALVGAFGLAALLVVRLARSGPHALFPGRAAWIAAFPLALAAGLLLRPVHRRTSSPGAPTWLPPLEDAAGLLAVVGLVVLVAVAAVHAARTGTEQTRRRAVHATGVALTAAGLLVAALGILVTVADPSALDYWAFGALAAPALLLVGAGLWGAAPRRQAAGT